jgi:surface antigen
MFKGLASAFEYDPDSDSLVKVQSMRHGRWYPYCITLENGQVVTIGGWDEWGCRNMLCEIYDPGSKSWSIKYNPSTSTTYTVGSCNPSAPAGLPRYGGSGQGVMPPVSLYPRALYMPTGLMAVAGQNPTTYTLNPETGRWVNAGILAVARSYGNMALLPLNNNASETGQLLVWGGSSTPAATATTVVELLTPNSGTNFTTFSFQTIASCNFGRRHAPAVYLPDGKLVTFGGTVYQNRLSDAHRNAEIFDPVAKNWTVVNGMTVPKLYHSAGILLPDGRVWLTGNSISKSNWELRSEYYVPSYYNATRPTISNDPAVGNYGESINIPTPDAASIEKVSLIRLSTFTHGFDSELRFIWLQIQSKGSNSVTVSAPLNGKIAPPGYYMIHVLNSAGVPSRASIIKIPGTATPPPPGDTTLPSVNITSPADGSTVSGASTGVTIAVTGTASDESGGSGIQNVQVQVGSNPFKPATATGPGGSGDWSTWSASDVVTSEGSVIITARATDNAGNIREDTNTVTVSFDSTGTYTTIYSQAGTNSYMVLASGGLHRCGEITTSASTLIGNSVKRVSVILKRAGNPTGEIRVVFRRGTGDSVATTFGTIQANTLTTTDQTFTLESPTSQTFAANDKILVEWDGTGTNTDQVHVKRHAYATSDASFDGINTRQTHKLATSTGYSTYNNADIAGVWFRLG